MGTKKYLFWCVTFCRFAVLLECMIKHTSFAVLLWVLLLTPAASYAQSYINSPALDSNCYFPTIGDPSQIDTIYGSKPYQELGNMMINLGPKPGGYGNMLIGGLSPTVALAQVQTGPSFNLHRMNATQKLAANFIGTSFWRGHFRDRSHLDIFTGSRIYWADDVGNYDSARYTDLKFSIQGIDGSYRGYFDPYVAPLVNDTIDDIVFGFYTLDVPSKEFAYLALYTGGARLAASSVVYEDTSINIGPSAVDSTYRLRRHNFQGDFRGSGRQDLLGGSDRFDLFYYKNDPPFTLAKLMLAMKNDTLWSRTDNVHWRDSTYPQTRLSWPSEALAMRALPKLPGDRSLDYLLSIPTIDDSDNGIFFFRGGPDFGSHRITIDSAAFVIRHPKNLDYGTFGYDYDWPLGILDAGDMTGTGNHILFVAASDGGTYAFQNFYATGKALDEKIDIFDGGFAAGWGDSLTATADSLEDFLMSRPGYSTPQDLSNGKFELGTLELYFGTKQIPMRLNPLWAAVKSIPQTDGLALTLSPNPANAWTVATIVWPEAEEGKYIISDMLGRTVGQDRLQLFGGGEQIRISFPQLSAGAYILTILGGNYARSARFINLSEGHASGPPNNFMQNLRNTINGNMPAFPEAEPILR